MDELTPPLIHARDVKPYKPIAKQESDEEETGAEDGQDEEHHTNEEDKKKMKNRALNSKGSRDRVPWGDDEIELLHAQMETHGHKWKNIALAFPERTSCDCRDKWRNLERKKCGSPKKKQRTGDDDE